MEKIKNFICAHFDFKFYGVSAIALIVGLLIIPCLLFMPQKYGYENGLLENLQMCVLFAIFAIYTTSKKQQIIISFLKKGLNCYFMWLCWE